jgi:hypothetical protein
MSKPLDKTVLVREYDRVRYGKPEVVRSHLRWRRNSGVNTNKPK